MRWFPSAMGLGLFVAVMHLTTFALADGEIVGQVSAGCAVSSVTGTQKALNSDCSLIGNCTIYETSRGITIPLQAYAINWTAAASYDLV
ncbi:MAG: hypothetical protein ACXWWE_03710 [Nitrospira sp.]